MDKSARKGAGSPVATMDVTEKGGCFAHSQREDHKASLVSGLNF